MKSVQFFPLILWYFMFRIKILIFWEERINSGPMFYMSKSFFGPSHYKNCLYVHEKLQINSSVGSCLKLFIFRPYGFDNLGFLTNARRGAMRSKPQFGLLQGSRLMAWTTESLIRENHWVPWGCRAHLGSGK